MFSWGACAPCCCYSISLLSSHKYEWNRLNDCRNEISFLGFVKMRRWECCQLKFTPPSDTSLSYSSFPGCWSLPPPSPPPSPRNSKPRVSPHFSRYRSFHKVCSLNGASGDHPGNNRERLVARVLDNFALCADLLGRLLICHNRVWWRCSSHSCLTLSNSSIMPTAFWDTRSWRYWEQTWCYWMLG